MPLQGPQWQTTETLQVEEDKQNSTGPTGGSRSSLYGSCFVPWEGPKATSFLADLPLLFCSVRSPPPLNWIHAPGNATDLSTSGERHTLRGEAKECFSLPASGSVSSMDSSPWPPTLETQGLFLGRSAVGESHLFPEAEELLLG